MQSALRHDCRVLIDTQRPCHRTYAPFLQPFAYCRWIERLGRQSPAYLASSTFARNGSLRRQFKNGVIEFMGASPQNEDEGSTNLRLTDTCTRVVFTSMLLPMLIICPLPLALALSLPIPQENTLNMTASTLFPVASHSQPFVYPLLNISSSYIPSDEFWYCFKSDSDLRGTTFRDCHHISQALDELDPTGSEDFVFSPRASADFRLPFYLRWGTCVLDVRGIEKDGWDMFPVGSLAEKVDDLALQ